MPFRRTLLLWPLLLISGCDFLSGEEVGTIIVTGQVVLTGTEEPLPGVSIALKDDGSFGLHFIRATVLTQIGEVFSLTYDASSNGTVHSVAVNDGPYDPRYTVYRDVARPGEETDLGVIKLAEN
ncbi:MAG: hypothetical protein IH855_12160 [Bacteroidetes bacterium]|nr:hypothetical protein [Bacteroidota bacterium]